MLTLCDPSNVAVATLETRSLGGGSHAMVLCWLGRAEVLPSLEASLPRFRSLIALARERGSLELHARVVTRQADLETAVVAARADWLRSCLLSLGFAQGSGRLEFQIPLQQAIAACAELHDDPRLVWRSVGTEVGPALQQAAQVLRAAASGDPDSDPDDDALGFLLARLEEKDLMLTPDCIRIGSCDGVDAAIVLSSVKPATGWCSLYYLGVLPTHRGRGLGGVAMAQGLSVMNALGGRIYHDGTGSGNPAALALLRRLAAEPYRTMEQWVLNLSQVGEASSSIP